MSLLPLSDSGKLLDTTIGGAAGLLGEEDDSVTIVDGDGSIS